MGLLNQLQDEDFRSKYTGISKYASKWKSFYGKDDIDRKLNQMLDDIQDIVGDLEFNQVIVHKADCPSCQESLPKFRMLKDALSERLPNYNGTELELKEKLRSNGELTEITGMDIYKLFENSVKGVPFITQDGLVDKNTGMMRAATWFVSYVGKLDPFRFLASAFNVENDWVTE